MFLGKMDQKCGALLRESSCPVILRGLIDLWPSRNWTPYHLSEVLKEKKYKCKIAPRKCNDQVWETDCAYIQASLSEFCDWTSGSIKGDNPLCHISPEMFSCYVDYKYMTQMFEDCSHMLKCVDWSVCGLTGRDGQDSTIWIGSDGASTPCHYDTYGFNLVAQIFGKKRWHLFPPSDSKFLYPTRLPYEESSIFSEVNVGHPDLLKTPLFKQSRAVVVTLEPGQVLYVPRHWWHYVECLETAVSINTWLELVSDDESRLTESITRATVSTLMSSEAGETLQDWINPNEDIMSMDVNWTYLKRCLQQVVHRTFSLETNESLEINNLHKFATYFDDSDFSIIHAPWNIPTGQLKACQTGSSKIFDNEKGSDVHNTVKKRYTSPTVVTVKRKHFIDLREELEGSPDRARQTKVLLLDSQTGHCKRVSCPKASSVPDFESHTAVACDIFALQPSTFQTFFQFVHGTTEWNNMDVGTSECDSTPTASGEPKQGFEDSVLDNREIDASNGRKELSPDKSLLNQDSLCMEKTLPDKVTTPEASRSATAHGDIVDSLDRSSTDRSSSRHGADDGDCVWVDNTDLSSIRDRFLKTLLHPRVVKVIAEELVESFRILEQ